VLSDIRERHKRSDRARRPIEGVAQQDTSQQKNQSEAPFLADDASMGLLHQAGAAIVLVTLTLAVQCAGMAALIDWVLGHFGRDAYRLGPVHSAALIVRFTSVMIVLHILQILLWAGFYRWQCFPSSEAAFYSSTSSYSTVGFGDVILPQMWRILGPVEGLTGVLMCGLSASLLFAIVTRLVDREVRFSPKREKFAAQSESMPAHSIDLPAAGSTPSR
jgi:voltage-gated potassium channel